MAMDTDCAVDIGDAATGGELIKLESYDPIIDQAMLNPHGSQVLTGGRDEIRNVGHTRSHKWGSFANGDTDAEHFSAAGASTVSGPMSSQELHQHAVIKAQENNDA